MPSSKISQGILQVSATVSPSYASVVKDSLHGTGGRCILCFLIASSSLISILKIETIVLFSVKSIFLTRVLLCVWSIWWLFNC
ncbi:hypothetical protein BKA64DRAFT_687584 [Cadophora sp. MPI-SDFR-AT-0126]|nr:hypothetical protein BKA64DRAFT_687584 [Leotiomycetes sp. MPI-SDFR-AT-0126]